MLAVKDDKMSISSGNAHRQTPTMRTNGDFIQFTPITIKAIQSQTLRTLSMTCS